MYYRPVFTKIYQRIQDKRRFIQVLAGPRQAGKTTLARQLLQKKDVSGHYASGDEPTLKNASWIEQQWEIGRLLLKQSDKRQPRVLILDEIQKINNWSDIVKKLWDEDSAAKLNLHVILLGSSPLQVQKGLSESLAGRFELIPITHWSFSEMRDAFNWNFHQFIYYGGYPGAAPLIDDSERWQNYIRDSLIETTISRDILLLNRVDKPALLKRLFELGCQYSGQILAFNKMLGQLQEAGNTTTLSHYLDLLSTAGMITGLPKYAGQKVRQRASTPKLLVLNTGLMSAASGLNFIEAQNNSVFWGRLVESSIGASLFNQLIGKHVNLLYWSSRNYEVDFVLQKGNSILALEVKSGQNKFTLTGIDKFSQEFEVQKKLLVGRGGIPLDKFLLLRPEELF
ncbi:MAG: AAA family ATPase [Caldithrix sp. RBG_13_44_9]|nr:MAG: AAA family ATPase [Caldithrix sp. RBG_13_44_9]